MRSQDRSVLGDLGDKEIRIKALAEKRGVKELGSFYASIRRLQKCGCIEPIGIEKVCITDKGKRSLERAGW